MQIQPTQFSAAIAAATPAAAGRDASSTSAASPSTALSGVTDVNKSEQSQDRDANEQYSNHQRRQNDGSNPEQNGAESGLSDENSLLNLEANDGSIPPQLDISG